MTDLIVLQVYLGSFQLATRPLGVPVKGMSAIGLPVHLLALFHPRVPAEFLPRPTKGARPATSVTAKLDGLADLNLIAALDEESRSRVDAPAVRASRRRDFEASDKHNACVVFVGRLGKDVTEKQVKREFEKQGGVVVRKMQIVYDRKGRSRRYGFAEFEDARMAEIAVERGLVVEGSRVLADRCRGGDAPWKNRKVGEK